MLDEELISWIADSESWHTHINFELKDQSFNYNFLDRSDDFYISLVSKLFDVLDENISLDINDKKEIFLLGKGLEIYSLENTRDAFKGVDYSTNMLLVASLYYISGYPTTSFILMRLFEVKQFKTEIQKFLYCFLSRNMYIENTYTSYLYEYLNTGNQTRLIELINVFRKMKELSMQSDPEDYVYFKISLYLIREFKCNNIWTDIKQNLKPDEDLDPWNNYISRKLFQNPSIWSFFHSQREALSKGILSNEQSYTLKMPTSAGKTAICEIIIYQHFLKQQDKKMLFLVPFRALAFELKKNLVPKIKNLGIISKVLYGGSHSIASDYESIEDVNLIIATPESFLSISSLLPDIENMINLVICDEGHLLIDNQRGIKYELLLSKMKNKKDPVRFIYLSAILPNIDNVNQWLGGDQNTLVTSNYKPTEVDIGFLTPNQFNNFNLEIKTFNNKILNYQVGNLLTKNDFIFLNNSTGRLNTYKFNSIKSRTIAIAVKSLNMGPVAIFTPTKGSNGIEGLAIELEKQLRHNFINLPKPSKYARMEKMHNLSTFFEVIFGSEYLLTRSTSIGMVYHHGDLPQNVRELIEEAIRNKDVSMMICTSTISEGVNLPIKTLLIHTTRIKSFNGKYYQDINIPKRNLKNLIGRAGRAGITIKGLIIVPNHKDFDIVEETMLNKGIDDTDGPLSEIIRAIARTIYTKQIKLTNTLLENQNENILKIIDDIDSSIISILAEEIKEDELEDIINELIKQTYAYLRLNSNEKEILKTVFNERGKKIKNYVKSNDYIILKKSNVNVRFYEQVRNYLDLDNDIWFTTDTPVMREWIELITQMVFNIPQINIELVLFNDRNNCNLTREDFMKIIDLWLKGYWYGEISLEMNLSVDKVLRLFNTVLNSFQNISTGIIKIAENLLVENDKALSESILSWPRFLSHGYSEKIQLDLHSSFTNNREIVIFISKVANQFHFYYENKNQLINLLIERREIILELSINNMSKYSYNELVSVLEILE
ncbi:DEAD/DEAH box helicase [Shouchella sp. JSM 1781072]|uniref:DEAD/DEAH box helicase n=1 Tax=Shouchella sp. JSM 1781072 TaxID=3344581 RepID=UPI0035BF4F83